MGGFRDAGQQRIVHRRLGQVLGGLGVSTLGNTAGTTGTVLGPVVLAGASGVTLSQSTQGPLATITIIASAENGVAIGAGTSTQLTGTVVFSNSNNLTFGLSAGTLTASAAAGAALSAGTQSANSGTVVFSNSNGVTFGLSNSSLLTASVSRGPVVSAGTQLASTGTVVFSNSNGISFGLSNSSVLTGSHNAVSELAIGDAATGTQVNQGIARLQFNTGNNMVFGKAVAGNTFVVTAQALAVAASAGTQLATSGTVVFSNSNGVSFGLSNSSVLTASVQASAVALAAGTQTATSGTVALSNSNGFTFGMSGSNQITASYDGVRALSAAGGGGIAGTITASSGSLGLSNAANAMASFLNSGNSVLALTANANVLAVGFGLNTTAANFGTVLLNTAPSGDSNGGGVNASLSTGGGGGHTLRLAPMRLSYLENWRAADLLGRDISASIQKLGVQRLAVPQVNVSGSQIDVLINISNSSSAGATMSLRWGMYTLSGSTASLASSCSATYAYNSTLGGSSSYTNVSNWRVFSAPANFNLTPGDYLIGFNIDIATALTSGSHSMMCGRNSTFLGEPYVSQNYSKYFDVGQVNTNGIPASIHLSAITQTSVSNSEAPNFPWFKLIGSF